MAVHCNRMVTLLYCFCAFYIQPVRCFLDFFNESEIISWSVWPSSGGICYRQLYSAIDAIYKYKNRSWEIKRNLMTATTVFYNQRSMSSGVVRAGQVRVNTTDRQLSCVIARKHHGDCGEKKEMWNGTLSKWPRGERHYNWKQLTIGHPKSLAHLQRQSTLVQWVKAFI